MSPTRHNGQRVFSDSSYLWVATQVSDNAHPRVLFLNAFPGRIWTGRAATPAKKKRCARTPVGGAHHLSGIQARTRVTSTRRPDRPWAQWRRDGDILSRRVSSTRKAGSYPGLSITVLWQEDDDRRRLRQVRLKRIRTGIDVSKVKPVLVFLRNASTSSRDSILF